MCSNLPIARVVAAVWLCLVVATAAADDTSQSPHGYAPVNGLRMYYELYGTADGKSPPLVLLHGGGSTIETTFGKVLPSLAKTRRVIAFEQQGHGHTADIADRPFSFEQSADDTAALMDHLKVEKADFFGFSNGGNIALQIAIRHPSRARKLVVASPHKPEDWPRVFEHHLNAGDLEAIMALYEQEARFVARSGETVVGRDAIRKVLATMIDAKTRLHSHVVKAVTVGDIAQLYTDFEGTTDDGSGKTVAIHNKAIEVLRRQPDGAWKLIVGDP